MNPGEPAAHGSGARAPSALRLRLGVLFVLLWILPFWALAPLVTRMLSGTDNPPSVASVTTVIVVVQTLIGLIGFVVAGPAVKALLQGSPLRKALPAIWGVLRHGEVRSPGQPAAAAAEDDGTHDDVQP